MISPTRWTLPSNRVNAANFIPGRILSRILVFGEQPNRPDDGIPHRLDLRPGGQAVGLADEVAECALQLRGFGGGAWAGSTLREGIPLGVNGGTQVPSVSARGVFPRQNTLHSLRYGLPGFGPRRPPAAPGRHRCHGATTR